MQNNSPPAIIHSMDIIDIKALLNETKGRYNRKQIISVFYCSFLSSYVLSLRNSSIWISVHPKYPYFDIAEAEKPCEKSPLSNLLRDMYITNISIANLDFLIHIELTHKYLPSQRKHLYIELQRNKTNLILTNSNSRIVFIHKEIEDKKYGRTLWRGTIYSPPPIDNTYAILEIPKLKDDDNFIIRGISKERRHAFSLNEIFQLWQDITYGGQIKEINSYLHVVDAKPQPISGSFFEYYTTLIEVEHQNLLKRQQEKQLNKQRKKLEKLLKNLGIELLSTENMNKYKKYGDLIMTYMSSPIYSESIMVIDWETGKEIAIPIEPGKPPQDIANFYYTKYKHLKKKRESVTKRISEVRKQLENLSKELRESTKQDRLLTSPSKPYMKFIDKYNNVYLVGKNNIGNHIVSFRLSSKKHLWFHAKNSPGSHVILKPTNNQFTKDSIITAAKLAAYFSKQRNSSKVEVVYTERKNVKPIKGAIGKVTYRNEQSIIVTPKSPREMKLLQIL